LLCRSRHCLFPLAVAAGSRLLPPPTINHPLVPPLPKPALSPSTVHFSTICGWLGRALVHVRLQLDRPVSNRTTAMDNSLDDEISTIVSLNNEFFCTHFFED
jgi:hypothetical protein